MDRIYFTSFWSYFLGKACAVFKAILTLKTKRRKKNWLVRAAFRHHCKLNSFTTISPIIQPTSAECFASSRSPHITKFAADSVSPCFPSESISPALAFNGFAYHSDYRAAWGSLARNSQQGVYLYHCRRCRFSEPPTFSMLWHPVWSDVKDTLKCI